MINSSQSTELYMENDGEIKLVNGQPRYNSGTLIITSQQTYLIFHHLQTRQSQKVSYFFFLNCGIIYIGSKSTFLVYISKRFDEHIPLCNHHSCIANTIKI